MYFNTDLELETIEYLKKQKYFEFLSIERMLKSNFIPSYPFGYIMRNKQKNIVGFMGAIFSIRTIDYKEIVFCNIHTWIIDETFRLYSDLIE